MPLAVLRGGPKLLRHGELGRVGIHFRLRRIPSAANTFARARCPTLPVIVEGARRQREELLLLGVVQYPVEVPVVSEEDEQGRGVDGWEGRTHNGPGAGQVALGEGHLGLHLDDVEVGGGECEAAVQGRLCLGVAPQPEQRAARCAAPCWPSGDRARPPV